MKKLRTMVCFTSIVLAFCSGDQVRQTQLGNAIDQLDPVARPDFSNQTQPPCESHTACYLAAKQAHQISTRTGFLITLERCEYYRGRYQLERFYGLCLLMLADAYRHLDNFAESKACYQRFVDTQVDQTDLVLQARESLDEVEQAETRPLAYRDYLRAIALLNRYGLAAEPDLLLQAKEILTRLQQEQADWTNHAKVSQLLQQIEAVQPASVDVNAGTPPDGVTDQEQSGTEPASQDSGTRTDSAGQEDDHRQSHQPVPTQGCKLIAPVLRIEHRKPNGFDLEIGLAYRNCWTASYATNSQLV